MLERMSPWLNHKTQQHTNTSYIVTFLLKISSMYTNVWGVVTFAVKGDNHHQQTPLG